MPDLQAGTLVGHYRIVRKLGSGGMADVYEAEDEKLGRRVALKVLPPELERSPGLAARFETEVRAAAKLSHRNIVTVFEVGHEGGIHFYSMRLLTGGDLRDRINRGMSPAECVAILRELAEAFSEAHAHGFVHRDVKPENVVFDDRGSPVLTDFGIAKVLNNPTGATATGTTIGTPKYMSPEQARAKPVDARTDLYSLGIVFYEMLVGKPPFESEEAIALIMLHVTEPTPRLPAELSMLQPLVDRMTAKEPDDRPASAPALIDLIDALPALPAAVAPDADALRKSRAESARRTLQNSALRAATPVEPPPALPPETVPTPPKRTTLVGPLVVIVIVLAIGAAALGYLMWPKPAAPEDVVVAPPVERATPEPKIASAQPVEEKPVEQKPVEQKSEPAPVEQPRITEESKPIMAEQPKPVVAEQPRPAPEAPNKEAARKMVAESRAAFARKEYKSAISYANSALILDPGNADAKKMLKKAQDAREAAMKSISVD